MFKQNTLIASVAAFAVASVSLLALATPLASGAQSVVRVADDSAYQFAADKRVMKKKKYSNGNAQNINAKNQKWAYDRNHHGNRYHSKRSGYSYYYGRYYYEQPWWNSGPGLSTQIF